ncbi:hypothetical protein DXT88_19065 [Herbaspirillum lusitanum]|nr:hypothetical protein [Herbaspirillum lusitanum]
MHSSLFEGRHRIKFTSLPPIVGPQTLPEADSVLLLLSGHAVPVCHWPEIIDSYALHRCQLKKDDA